MRRKDRFKAQSPAQNRGPSTPATTKWFKITNAVNNDPCCAEIRLRGYIGQPQYQRDYYSGEMVRGDGAGTLQEFESELMSLGDQVTSLTVYIFSEGGEVWTGMAIANLLQRHPATKTCIIDGICASAATYIALACDEVQIPSNAWMMIHGSTGCCCGGAEDMHQYGDMLDSMNATIVNLYVARTGKSEADVTAMLQQETWMDGQTAVENGFADTVIQPIANLAARAGTLQPTNSVSLRHAPVEVLALFDMTRLPNPANSAIPNSAPPTMLRPKGPLMNAADAGGAVSPGAAPVVPPAVTPPVVPVVPVVEAPAPGAAPVNATPGSPFNLADITAAMGAAVEKAIAPLNARLEVIEGQRKAGISPENLGGAAPAPVAGGESPPVTQKLAHPLNAVGKAWASAAAKK